MDAEASTSSNKDKVCRLIIQQCLSANLSFDTEDEPVSIGKGMVVFVCFLQKATTECLENIVKSVLNVKLCEMEEDSNRKSVLDTKYDLLVVPQATLGGKLKGKSIQYHGIVSKSVGAELFTEFVIRLKEGVRERNETGEVNSGVYGARQILKMETNGPFTHIFEF